MKTDTKNNYLGVALGRFAPLHFGHQLIIDRLITDFGDNSLVIIGSSNAYNTRTPYTFSVRKKMIKTLYPSVKVVGFPDVNPNKDLFEERTLKTWIKNLKKLETKMKAQFIFYAGSSKDVGYLKNDFEVKIVTDRRRGAAISATKVRELISANNMEQLKEYLHSNIIPLAIEGLKEFENGKK